MLRNLTDDVVRVVEAYDPEGTAVWLTTPFIGTGPVLGREVVCGRPDAWFALEDKLVVDDIWDAVGAPRAASCAVPVDPRRAARGRPPSWTGGTARSGRATRARGSTEAATSSAGCVTDRGRRPPPTTFFSRHCDRVRVMPFLDGVPCSIHGLVMATGTAVFRPVELAIAAWPRPPARLQRPGHDMAPARRRIARQMRGLARRTGGQRLREQVGYRGAFGIDGIITVDGFRPTRSYEQQDVGGHRVVGAGRRPVPVQPAAVQPARRPRPSASRSRRPWRGGRCPPWTAHA